MALSTISGVGAGSSGTILTTGSSGQIIPKAALPTGSVLQVVNATSSSIISGTGQTAIITASITPISTSSKVLAIGTLALGVLPTSNSYVTGRIYRGTTSGTQVAYVYCGVQSAINSAQNVSVTGLDSPSTTSSQTYTLSAATGSGGTASWTTDGTQYSLTLMEIAA